MTRYVSKRKNSDANWAFIESPASHLECLDGTSKSLLRLYCNVLRQLSLEMFHQIILPRVPMQYFPAHTSEDRRSSCEIKTYSFFYYLSIYNLQKFLFQSSDKKLLPVDRMPSDPRICTTFSCMQYAFLITEKKVL